MTTGKEDPAERRGSREPAILAVILLIGVAARAVHYFANRSLWLDEAMLALNIGERSFAELAGDLHFNQAAPLGFLWLEKIAVSVAGVSELALRLWPYLASVAALLVFTAVARRSLATAGSYAAVSLFALSTSLVYYAAEVKQYSFDVLWVTVLLLLALRAGRARETGEGALGGPAPAEPPARGVWTPLLLAGVAGVWFSHALVFVLPAALLYLLLETRGRGRASASMRARRPLAVLASAWAASFALAYLLTAQDTSQNPLMQRFWLEGFMPLPPTSAAEWRWFADAAAGLFRLSFDFTETVSPARTAGIWLAGGLTLAGLFHGWARRRPVLALLAAPIGLALAASAVRLYPFSGRLLLFLVPCLILLIGLGVDGAWRVGLGVESVGRSPRATASGFRGARAAGARFLRRGLRAAGLGGAGIATATGLLVVSGVVLGGWLQAPYREELRPVTVWVASNAREGDVVYLHSGAQHAYEFYRRYCEPCRAPDADVRRGRFLSGQDSLVAGDVAALPPTGRVWALFAHEWWGFGAAERREILLRLGQVGEERARLEVPGASAYLFELPGP